jgi:acyl-CoA thioester hydrolase
MRHFTTEIRVRYGETDKMGVAHHSSYLLWFELGRTGLLREAGHSYRGMEEKGIMLPVLEYSVQFHVGAEYDDAVKIETVVSRLRSRTVTFAYRAVRGSDLLATGKTRHLCVDLENQFRRIPREVAEAIAPYVLPAGETFDPA